MNDGNKSGENHPTLYGEKKVVCPGSLTGPSDNHLKNKMFKRPIPKPRVSGTAYAGGRAVCPLASGRAADVVRSMRAPPPAGPLPTKWTPPMEYEFVAARMPEAEAGPFIARCEAWFAAHARVVVPKPEPSALDPAPLIALFAKHKDHRPPCEEMCAAMLSAGQTEMRITRYRKWCKNMDDTKKERQEFLEAIFIKYPSANKPVPKKKKVIKAVKKKTA